uniref:Flp pilus assembly protein ATPase CpaF n=1 Tax=uncultured bacterium CSLF43 TaxID=1091575 RepID=G4WW33_9BACT|nr:Flp pilus assembly protein ATPase CpaF [uncultured bacterium CSLF43]
MSNPSDVLGVFQDAIRNYLGPVMQLWEDPTVTEILINGFEEIFVERKGKLERSQAKFRSEDDLLAAIRSISQSVGRHITEAEPRVDARLPDGSRFHAVIRPCARNGPTASIRKFTQSKITFKDYIKLGAITPDGASFLEVCMFLGKNMLISGGTGSGKTTLLGLLCNRIPKGYRIIVIEDASELTIEYEHVVRFETRLPDERGKHEVSTKDLLKSSLRLRPDRIIVGEVRGSEGFDLVQAMNTGHNGSMGTIHANSSADALVRLEALSMGGETKISDKAMQYSIAAAIDIVVQISRLQDGSRRIMEISEVRGLTKDYNYDVVPIYNMPHLVRGPDGKLVGNIEPTGEIPSFMAEIEDNRIPFPRSKFFSPKAS